MDDRRKWAVFAVLLAAVAGAVALVAVAGGDDDASGRLTVERSTVPGTQQPELLVSVERELNVPETAKDGRSVMLECVDDAGRRVIRARTEWPFLEEPNYPLPHAHQPATDAEIARVAECRVTGATVPLSGRMRLPD